MMRRKVLNMSVDSWSEAIEFARSERIRTNRAAIAFEYQEPNSCDGMMFYEVGDSEHVTMMALNYVIIRTEQF